VQVAETSYEDVDQARAILVVRPGDIGGHRHERLDIVSASQQFEPSDRGWRSARAEKS
jgi:hypothetical protein